MNRLCRQEITEVFEFNRRLLMLLQGLETFLEKRKGLHDRNRAMLKP
jgi:hypothetical protein